MRVIASIFVLSSVLIWEVINDSRGESKYDKRHDWGIRTIISIISVMASMWILRGLYDYSSWNFLIKMFSGILMTAAIHFLVFDFAIVIILKKNGVIKADANPFTYLGKTANYPKWWLKCGPWGRFSIRLAVFAIALLIYF